ncbi:MAG: hypothetical protein RSG22_11105 [Comamonas sp.]
MASIRFIGIPERHIRVLVKTFNLIAEGKRKENIDEDAVMVVLGNLCTEKFIFTKAESEYWLKKWQENPNIHTPWDFGSWIDALSSAEIDLKELILFDGGSGSIVFEQLAWPSGGLEAIEQIVKVFDGTVLENSGF